MRKVCKFEIWDYMDPYPLYRYNRFEGDTLEEIEQKAKQHEEYMSLNWSGGTTKFEKILDLEGMQEWLKSSEEAYKDNPKHAAWIGIVRPEIIQKIIDEDYREVTA